MEYIKRNIIKVNFFTILSSIIILPIMFFINFNFTANKTYQKSFYALQEGNPPYNQPITLQDKPIINSETLTLFSKMSVVDIFSHAIHESNEHTKAMSIYFTDLGYKKFVESYKPILESNIETGTVIKTTIVTKGPYLLGTASIIGQGRIWKYILGVVELREGLGGQESKSKTIELVLKEVKFSKNKKGVAIDSLIVK